VGSVRERLSVWRWGLDGSVMAAGSWRGCVVGSVGNVSCGFSFLFLGFGWVEL